ncbi:DUF2127 domain-containing protein [Dermabacteraceae bacterium P13101]
MAGKSATAVKHSYAAHRWELWACGIRGHLTYRPTDRPDLWEGLCSPTAHGEAWRCLRCGNYILGKPRGEGEASAAPTPLRGMTLRDAFIMRFFAIERFLRAALLALPAYGVWRFAGARDSLPQAFAHYLPLTEQAAALFGIDLHDSLPVRLARQLLFLHHNTLLLAMSGVLLLAFLELLEGIGLWSLRRWGEYVAVVITSLLVPYEIYDLIEKVTVLRVGTFVVNLLLIAWLVFTKRLFGVRGGGAAYAAEHEGAAILRVERSAN